MGLKLVIGLAENRQDAEAEVVFLGHDADDLAKAMAGNTTSRSFVMVSNPQGVGIWKHNPNFAGPAPQVPSEPIDPDEVVQGQVDTVESLVDGKSKEELVALAESEGVPVPEKATKPVIASAIIAAREASQDDDGDETPNALQS
jgi:hypothetical protein